MRKIPIPLVFAAILLAAIPIMVKVTTTSVTAYLGPTVTSGGLTVLNGTVQGKAMVNGSGVKVYYTVLPVVAFYGPLVNITSGNYLLYATSTAKCAAVLYNGKYLGYQLVNYSGVWIPVFRGQGPCPSQIGANNVTYISGVTVSATGLTMTVGTASVTVPAIYIGASPVQFNVGNYASVATNLVGERLYYIVANGTATISVK